MANTELVSGTTMTTMGQGTNNHVEGWHSQLKKIVGKSHPNTFEIINVMRKEQATTEMKLNQFEDGAIQPSRKRRYVQKNYIELTLWELISWEVDLVGVDLVGVDFVGVDLVGVDLVGGHLLKHCIYCTSVLPLHRESTDSRSPI